MVSLYIYLTGTENLERLETKWERSTVKINSVRYRIAIGPHSGNRTLRLHDPSCIKTDNSPKPLTVDRDGFSLNAAVSCKPYQRERLERLCRYITRPAICLDRLNVNDDGQIQYELKNPFCNGATHILFSHLDFLSKLAALLPRPRHHLVRYHGIFAPNARFRKRIVPTKAHIKAQPPPFNSEKQP